MEQIKRVHKNLGRVRVVSIVGRFGFYVQIKPLSSATGIDVAWQSIAQWDFLVNAKYCAEHVFYGVSGGFVSDVHPIER